MTNIYNCEEAETVKANSIDPMANLNYHSLHVVNRVKKNLKLRTKKKQKKWLLGISERLLPTVPLCIHGPSRKISQNGN